MFFSLFFLCNPIREQILSQFRQQHFWSSKGHSGCRKQLRSLSFSADVTCSQKRTEGGEKQKQGVVCLYGINNNLGTVITLAYLQKQHDTTSLKGKTDRRGDSKTVCVREKVVEHSIIRKCNFIEHCTGEHERRLHNEVRYKLT